LNPLTPASELLLLLLLVQANDSTALHVAAAGGHADVVRHLIDSGAPADVENAVIANCYTAVLTIRPQTT